MNTTSTESSTQSAVDTQVQSAADMQAQSAADKQAHSSSQPKPAAEARRTRKSRKSPNLHPEGTLRVRYRIRFAKTDLLRWISHRDLASLWERIGRRVGLPFSMTEGFHPKPRLMFPSALPLGVESLDEVVDLELGQEWDEQELLSKLRQDEQPGLTIHHATRVDLTEGKAYLAGRQYQVSLPDEWDNAQRLQVGDAIANLLQTEFVKTERDGKKTVVTHVPVQIPLLELQEQMLVVRLINSDSASLKIHDVLDLLDIADWPDRGATITRTHTFLRGESLPELNRTEHS